MTITFHGIELTEDQLVKVMTCKTPEELQSFSKDIGIDISMSEAAAYLHCEDKSKPVKNNTK